MNIAVEGFYHDPLQEIMMDKDGKPLDLTEHMYWHLLPGIEDRNCL